MNFSLIFYLLFSSVAQADENDSQGISEIQEIPQINGERAYISPLSGMTIEEFVKKTLIDKKLAEDQLNFASKKLFELTSIKPSQRTADWPGITKKERLEIGLAALKRNITIQKFIMQKQIEIESLEKTVELASKKLGSHLILTDWEFESELIKKLDSSARKSLEKDIKTLKKNIKNFEFALETTEKSLLKEKNTENTDYRLISVKLKEKKMNHMKMNVEWMENKLQWGIEKLKDEAKEWERADKNLAELEMAVVNNIFKRDNQLRIHFKEQLEKKWEWGEDIRRESLIKTLKKDGNQLMSQDKINRTKVSETKSKLDQIEQSLEWTQTLQIGKNFEKKNLSEKKLDLLNSELKEFKNLKLLKKEHLEKILEWADDMSEYLSEKREWINEEIRWLRKGSKSQAENSSKEKKFKSAKESWKKGELELNERNDLILKKSKEIQGKDKSRIKKLEKRKDLKFLSSFDQCKELFRNPEKSG